MVAWMAWILDIMEGRHKSVIESGTSVSSSHCEAQNIFMLKTSEAAEP